MDQSDYRDKKITVSEIFYSIQGEGGYTGMPCVFIRLTECNLRCSWCDTTYSYSNGTEMTIKEILQKVGSINCNTVEITGGEPLLQKNTAFLLESLRRIKSNVLLETNGSISIKDVPKDVHILMDIKTPSSGESMNLLIDNFSFLKSSDELKVIVANNDDFEWAKKMDHDYNLSERLKRPIIFQPVYNALDPKDLANWILESGRGYKLGIQLHKYIYGENIRGV